MPCFYSISFTKKPHHHLHFNNELTLSFDCVVLSVITPSLSWYISKLPISLWLTQIRTRLHNKASKIAVKMKKKICMYFLFIKIKTEKREKQNCWVFYCTKIIVMGWIWYNIFVSVCSAWILLIKNQGKTEIYLPL